MNSEALKMGLRKKSGQIDLTWKELGKMFDIDGEILRQRVKHHQMRNGKLQGKYEKGRKRILILSDLHVPDHREDMILEIVQNNRNVHKIILAGDILDCHAVSAWMNEDITILDYEMIEGHSLLKKIRAITKADIILVKGNHEERVNRHFAKNAKAMGSAVVETEVLYKLANGFTVKTKKGKRIEYPAIEGVEYSEGRSYVYGNLIVNHPSIFSKDPMKAVYRMYNEKLKRKYPQGKVFVIGHTHQLGMVFVDNEIILAECGCTCKPALYADKDDRPMKIQQYGYMYLEMINDTVDINSIELKYMGCDMSYEEYEDIDDF